MISSSYIFLRVLLKSSKTPFIEMHSTPNTFAIKSIQCTNAVWKPQQWNACQALNSSLGPLHLMLLPYNDFWGVCFCTFLFIYLLTLSVPLIDYMHWPSGKSVIRSSLVRMWVNFGMSMILWGKWKVHLQWALDSALRRKTPIFKWVRGLRKM